MSKLFTVKMPDIGEGVVEGEVIDWLKRVGEAVAQDEPIVVVMTDKATVELPSPYPGKLAKQCCKVGEKAIKGLPLYELEIADGTSVKDDVQAEVPSVKDTSHPSIQKKQSSIPQKKAEEQIQGNALASPKVRKLSMDLGIDLSHIRGTGKHGQITEEDLKQHIAATPHASPSKLSLLPDDEEKPLIGVRHLMVKKMAEAHAQIPHFSYFEQADATRLMQLRKNIKEKATQESISVTFMPFFIKALSLTIKQFPVINSSLKTTGNALILHKQQNIGIAMASEHGLIVPVLKMVQNMNLETLIKSYEALKQKAVAGKLTPAEMKDGTISISNFGVLDGGGLWATPIINFPEVAILAIARIQKQPFVKHQTVVAADVLNFSWSFDHRVIDGDLAAAISHYYCNIIRNPAVML